MESATDDAIARYLRLYAAPGPFVSVEAMLDAAGLRTLMYNTTSEAFMHARGIHGPAVDEVRDGDGGAVRRAVHRTDADAATAERS